MKNSASPSNSKFGKKVADYIVTKPAAASNFLPKITFGAFTAASITEMAQAGGTKAYIWLVAGLLFCFMIWCVKDKSLSQTRVRV